jgi:CBS domain-containing protein
MAGFDWHTSATKLNKPGTTVRIVKPGRRGGAYLKTKTGDTGGVQPPGFAVIRGHDMPIEDILTEQSRALITVGPNDTVQAAARLLANNDIGALPVYDVTGKMVGILSERDIIRNIGIDPGDLEQITVAELMKTDVVTCQPHDRIRDVIQTMNDRRIRHVPVLDNGRLVAMLSVRDLFTYLLEATQAQRDTMTLAYEMLR